MLKMASLQSCPEKNKMLVKTFENANHNLFKLKITFFNNKNNV